MAKSDTWMAIYWGDYWKDTGHLSAAEHGAYLNLIGAYWVSGKPLPADDARLARLAKTANEKEWQRLKPAVTEFFQQDGNTYRHARIDKELQKAQAHSEAKAKAGARGGAVKWGTPGNKKSHAATRAPKAIPQRQGHFPAYMWHVRRAGKGGRRTYRNGEFDLLALVALDCRSVAYLPPSRTKQTVHIRTHDDPNPPKHGGKVGKTFAQFPFSAALAEVLHG